jgi:hypothetical protein
MKDQRINVPPYQFSLPPIVSFQPNLTTFAPEHEPDAVADWSKSSDARKAV